MINPNFLNKNYSKYHSQSPITHSSRAFLPTHLNQQLTAQNIREQPSCSQQLSPVHHSPIPSSNHCSLHPDELLRHLCLDCIELLCPECISEHIAIHR
jgi:hypothetical protein